MAFPAVATTRDNGVTADTTSHVHSRAIGVAGRLTVVVFGFDGGSNVVLTDLGGFTQFGRLDDSTNFGVAFLYRAEDGTEGSTFTITTDDSEKSVTGVWHITGAADPSVQPPEVATAAGASSTTKDCPSISPTGGAKDYLFICGYLDDGEEADDGTWVNNDPADYGSRLVTTSGTGGQAASNVSLAASRRTANTATEDPASQTGATDVAHASCLFTIAVHPASIVLPFVGMPPMRAAA